MSEGNPARGNCRGQKTSDERFKAVTMRMALVAALCAGASACTTMQDAEAEIGTDTKFTESEFGVAASERVTTSRSVPKGGGHVKIGEPYQVAGRWYTPELDPDYHKVGLASWYGPNFHGRKTANGEIFDQYHLSAAHPTFPLPSYARVTNQENGRSVLVRVNDRGPFSDDRIIDVSSKTAQVLGFKADGVAEVSVSYVGPARLDGQDMPFLMASLQMPGETSPAIGDETPARPGVMLAMNEVGTGELPGVASDALAVQARLAEAHSTPEAVPAAAPDVATAVPAAAGAASLPDVGPVLPQRPGAGTVQAYAQTRISGSAEPFDAVLDESAMLTADAIIGAWEQRHR